MANKRSNADAGPVVHGFVRCALVLAAALPCSAQDACFTVPVDLRGPLQSARFEALGVHSEVRLELAEGELRTVSLPFGGGSLAELEPSAAAAALRVTTQPAAGSVIVRAEHASGPGKTPRALGRRGRPPVLPERPRPDRARLLVMLGGVVLLCGLRKRPRAAAGSGALTATLMLALPAAPLEGRELRGIDGDYARAQWLEVQSAHGRLELAAGGEGWFEVRGSGAAQWELDGAGRVTLRAESGEVHHLRRLDAGPLDPRNGHPVHALREVWTRSADGIWTELGDWEPGTRFPPPVEHAGGTAGPTGWLAAGLPQGVEVFVAAPVGPGAPDWLRITSFPALESE